MQKPLKSRRADGKGHWPAGKRRSPLTARERRALVALVHRAIEAESARAVARALGVSDRTVRRWRDEIDVPMPEQAAAMRERLKFMK